jgi:hypothetical protein
VLDGGGGFGPQEKPKPPADTVLERYSQARRLVRRRRQRRLVEEDERPDGARVLRAVAAARLDPPALEILGREDRGDRVGRHRGGSRRDHVGIVGRPVDELAQGAVADGRGGGF